MKKFTTIFLSICAFSIPAILSAQSYPAFKVKADKLEGINDERIAKMEAALLLFEKVMNDGEFQKKLADTSFYFDVMGDPNKLLSKKELFDKIYAAKEFYKDSADYTANIHWMLVDKRKPFLSFNPAIGYGDPADVEIYTYTFYFDQNSGDALENIAGHIAHEWIHKLGFQHQFNKHKNRNKTVPYAFGNMVKEFAKRYK